MLDNITLTQNDQSHALIPKDQFLSEPGPFKHLSQRFFDAMREISDKVQRTVGEKADSAVYAIKAKVNFSNADIYENDLFLSASTESAVDIRDTVFRDVVATGKLFQAVSSSIEMSNTVLKNIKYNKSSETDSFYKVSIVNKSVLKTLNCTWQFIDGLLLYVSGSTLVMSNGTQILDNTNDDPDSPLWSVDSSTLSLSSCLFSRLSSLFVTPLFSL